MFDGRFEEAERVNEGAVELRSRGHGALGGVDDTTFYYVTHLQTWALRRERGELAERTRVDRALRRAVPDVLHLPLCAGQHLQPARTRRQQAQQEIDRLGADDFAGLEVGTEWHFGACLLAEACAALGDARHAPRIYEALEPYGEYNVMAHPEFSLGSAARYLGLVAATMSRWEQAESHFERALTHECRDGHPALARPLPARLRRDAAGPRRAGRARTSATIIREAVNSYRELGMRHWADEASELEQGL